MADWWAAKAAAWRAKACWWEIAGWAACCAKRWALWAATWAWAALPKKAQAGWLKATGPAGPTIPEGPIEPDGPTRPACGYAKA